MLRFENPAKSAGHAKLTAAVEQLNFAERAECGDLAPSLGTSLRTQQRRQTKTHSIRFAILAAGVPTPNCPSLCSCVAVSEHARTATNSRETGGLVLHSGFISEVALLYGADRETGISRELQPGS